MLLVLEDSCPGSAGDQTRASDPSELPPTAGVTTLDHPSAPFQLEQFCVHPRHFNYQIT